VLKSFLNIEWSHYLNSILKVKIKKALKKITRICIVIAISLIVMATFCCCKVAKKNEDVKSISVVTTNFPLYDFARVVLEDLDGMECEVSMLLKPGMETHSYEPTPSNIIEIENCDLFLYIGGESDEWVEEIIDSVDKEVNCLALMDFVEALEEEEDTEHEHEHSHDHESEEIEYDEHIWTSPLNAIKMIEAIETEIVKIANEKNAKEVNYSMENTNNYIDEIKNLDREFRSLFDAHEDAVLFFGDRFPFAYFVHEYDISWHAAFPGCYEGSEPSAAGIARLIDEAKELNVNTIYYIEMSNHQIADVIAESVDGNTAMIHSCHNVTQDEFDSGETYVSLMKRNLETYKETVK